MAVLGIILILGLMIFLFVKSNKTDIPRDTQGYNPIADMYSNLTMGQKYSILQLYSLCNVTCFENFANSKISYGILMAASNSLGITIQQANKYFETHGEFGNLIAQMRSISDKSILNLLLFDYTQMIMLTNDQRKKNQRSDLISSVYAELGYTADEMKKAVEKAAAVAGMFNR